MLFVEMIHDIAPIAVLSYTLAYIGFPAEAALAALIGRGIYILFDAVPPRVALNCPLIVTIFPDMWYLQKSNVIPDKVIDPDAVGVGAQSNQSGQPNGDSVYEYAMSVIAEFATV